jgi:hypothetical protein
LKPPPRGADKTYVQEPRSVTQSEEETLDKEELEGLVKLESAINKAAARAGGGEPATRDTPRSHPEILNDATETLKYLTVPCSCIDIADMNLPHRRLREEKTKLEEIWKQIEPYREMLRAAGSSN